MRQKEAVELAQQSDYMVVVGGKSSSNTLKLYEICSRFCETALVETKSELDKSQIFRHNRIGVTAGASTPADIIKEVQTTMTEILENHDEEPQFCGASGAIS